MDIRRLNYPMFVACLAGGAVGFLFGEIILNRYRYEWNEILLVGVYFAQLMFFICLACLICEHLSPRLRGIPWDSWDRKVSLFMLPVVSIVLFFLVGALFQFIYGLGYKSITIPEADDYIFVIDNSGSTAKTDPGKQRFSDVLDFAGSLDGSKKIMISIFNSMTEMVLPLEDISPSTTEKLKDIFSQYDSNGNTDIELALETSLDNYPESDRTAMVILLSDGISNVNIDSITGKYNERSISINTIGFSNNGWAGRNLLLKLAELTKGSFYPIGSISRLSGTLKKIRSLENKRMLLDYRYGNERDNLLLLLLRIILIAILGALLCASIGFLVNLQQVIFKLLPVRIIAGILAGLALEFGFLYLWGELLTRGVTCLLLALVLAPALEISQSHNEHIFGGNHLRETEMITGTELRLEEREKYSEIK